MDAWPPSRRPLLAVRVVPRRRSRSKVAPPSVDLKTAAGAVPAYTTSGSGPGTSCQTRSTEECNRSGKPIRCSSRVSPRSSELKTLGTVQLRDAPTSSRDQSPRVWAGRNRSPSSGSTDPRWPTPVTSRRSDRPRDPSWCRSAAPSRHWSRFVLLAGIWFGRVDLPGTTITDRWRPGPATYAKNRRKRSGVRPALFTSPSHSRDTGCPACLTLSLTGGSAAGAHPSAPRENHRDQLVGPLFRPISRWAETSQRMPAATRWSPPRPWLTVDENVTRPRSSWTRCSPAELAPGRCRASLSPRGPARLTARASSRTVVPATTTDGVPTMHDR